MLLNPKQSSTREKLILTGLYLSKFDTAGVRALGFDSFVETFNVIGYGLGAKPASIKNYRDEFDPLFSNGRKGWHKRATRDYCLKIFKEYQALDFRTFTDLVKSFAGFDENIWSGVQETEEKSDEKSYFAKRMITGLAAEHYFESVRSNLIEFKDYTLENTTRLGCGYDFRLHAGTQKDFLAIEVKGLKEKTGSLSLTPKEYDLATALTDRFYLFVVKNFRETPFHEIYQNPLSSSLRFAKKERVVIQVAWAASV